LGFTTPTTLSVSPLSTAERMNVSSDDMSVQPPVSAFFWYIAEAGTTLKVMPSASWIVNLEYLGQA
jgi:hypothetical protein